ncbi:phytanoyl-CoA dioxygenase family protein [Deinococcus sp. QL22]|uniref:phytanoyl-CoA dioxygenase family protein n=1 Tax=Deinococcus sp. QL22 TaxID=2939437 RepID=UPI002016D190|nr:phytanoyl-CoA dioxygenase family protein [Deinococcus sp. QL22]UQN09736.1 phytanoyl-CoA dioxygenase family protein [Deinococcus sp. QL22]
MTALTPVPTSPGPSSVSSASLTPLSLFHLNAKQVQLFDEYGYLVLRHWVRGDLLTRLQAAGQRWIERGLADSGKNSDPLFAEREVGRVMWRVDYVHDKGEPVSLELLGSPGVLGVAESLCGPNFG